MSSFTKSPYMKRYIFKHINHYYWQLKYACQRFVKGYDSLDVIGVDYWFSTTLENIMKDFNKHNIGYPQGCTFDGFKVNTPEDWDAVLKDFYETIKMYNELEYGLRFTPTIDGEKMSDEEFCEYLKNRTFEDIKAEQDLINRYEKDMLHKFSILYGRLWI